MNESTRKTMINATAKAYREHAAALRAIVPVISKFDGKILDKRLETAMNAAALPDGMKYHFSWSANYGEFRISAYNHNRSYKETPDTPGGYACTGYIKNESICVYVGKYADVFDTTPGGKWRIRAAAIIPAIEAEANRAENDAAEVEKALENRAAMVAELQAIADQLRAFEKKYSHEARDLNGVYYSLNYCGSSDTRDYSIR